LNINNTESPDLQRRSSQSSVNKDDLDIEESSDTKPSQSLYRNSSDPNLTLISVYSPETLPNLELNVQRSSATLPSRSSQVFSLFRVPNRDDTNPSTSDNKLLQTIDKTVSREDSNTTKPNIETITKQKRDKTSRFISFIRFIFCQLVPIHSNATVTPAIEHSTSEDNHVLPPVHLKVDQIFFLKKKIKF
jgi:hypothetical protein